MDDRDRKALDGTDPSVDAQSYQSWELLTREQLLLTSHYLWRNLVQSPVACRSAKLCDGGGNDKEATKDQEGDNRPQRWNKGSNHQNTDAAAYMSNAIDQRKARRTRPGGIVFSGPGPPRGHKQIEANEEDNGADSRTSEIAGPAQ